MQVRINDQAVDLEKGVTPPAAKPKKPLTFWSSRKEMEEGFNWHGDEGKQVERPPTHLILPYS
jgi:hypothetical protein